MDTASIILWIAIGILVIVLGWELWKFTTRKKNKHRRQYMPRYNKESVSDFYSPTSDKFGERFDISVSGGSEGIYYGGDPADAEVFGGDLESEIYGGASTSNLVLLKKQNGDYKVLLGRLKEHGNKLQLPGGFVEGDEDMEMAALRGASGMTGEDYVTAYYGKGAAKTALYKDTLDTKRANVVIIVDKDPKLNKFEQNNELDPCFSKDKTRTVWVSAKRFRKGRKC